MIHVKELTKSYADLHTGQFKALDRVSFSVKAGEIFGLLGPNGAGKTTLLRILSTLLRPTSGVATVNGYDVSTQPSLVRHQIGFVSSNTAVYDRMTAFELVEYFGQLHGMHKDEVAERIDSLFDQLEMNDIRDVLVAKMSSGMKQKVSIARALVHEPPVLVFDEATVGLDVLVGRALLQTVSALRDQGKCILFSTHIMREVERLCDRIAIMNRGSILATGTREELMEEHNQPDMEELFFEVLSNSETARRLAAGNGIPNLSTNAPELA